MRKLVPRCSSTAPPCEPDPPPADGPEGAPARPLTSQHINQRAHGDLDLQVAGRSYRRRRRGRLDHFNNCRRLRRGVQHVRLGRRGGREHQRKGEHGPGQPQPIAQPETGALLGAEVIQGRRRARRSSGSTPGRAAADPARPRVACPGKKGRDERLFGRRATLFMVSNSL